MSVLYCRKPWKTNGIMLTMKTDYKNATELLAETEVWSGVISSVNIIEGGDYLYPQNTVPLAEQGVEQSTNGPICYGRIFFNKDTEMVERLCYSCDSIDQIGAFKNTFERFGVLE